jgi:hypothetical protein
MPLVKRVLYKCQLPEAIALVLVKFVVVVAVIVVWAAGEAVMYASPPFPIILLPACILASVFQFPEPKVKVIFPEVAEGVNVTA